VAASDEALPTYDQLVQDLTIASIKRRALVQRAPAKLSFDVDVPEQASLSFRVGQNEGSGAQAKVRVQPEGGAEETLFDQPLKAARSHQRFSLAGFTPTLVRIA